MPFAYYRRLSPALRKVYRQSDGVVSVTLPNAASLRPLAERARECLEDDERGRLQATCQELSDRLLAALGVPPVRVRVLAARPTHDWGELHGLYEPEEDDRRARVTVWMRTAQRRQIVAFKTFLRTLAHEIAHHLDYEHLRLAESLHTEGFFRRESSLVAQLLPPAD